MENYHQAGNLIVYYKWLKWRISQNDKYIACCSIFSSVNDERKIERKKGNKEKNGKRKRSYDDANIENIYNGDSENIDPDNNPHVDNNDNSYYNNHDNNDSIDNNKRTNYDNDAFHFHSDALDNVKPPPKKKRKFKRRSRPRWG